MSGTLLSIPSNGATDWTDWVTREQQTEKDFKFISLTNWSNSTIPQIEAGSQIIVNGALYQFSSDDTISGLSAVGNSNDVWFKVVPSGSTCTVTAVTTDGSSWDADKGGYYDSNDLYIGGCYKDDSGNYINKWVYKGRDIIDSYHTEKLTYVIIEIGNWDMDTDAFILVNHSLGDGFVKIRSITAIIRSDDNTLYFDFKGVHVTAIRASSTQIYLERENAGLFDSADFDTAIAYNRGWIKIEFEV